MERKDPVCQSREVRFAWALVTTATATATTTPTQAMARTSATRRLLWTRLVDGADPRRL